MDLSILRGFLHEDLIIPTREELVTEQKADSKLKQLRNLIEFKQPLSADELARCSDRVKSFAQLFDKIFIWKQVMVIRQLDDPKRELTIVVNRRLEHIFDTITKNLDALIKLQK